MPDDTPAILTTAQAAKYMGIGEQTLRDWAGDDQMLAHCILRQTKRSTWWSVQRLRDRGYLTKPESNKPPSNNEGVTDVG